MNKSKWLRRIFGFQIWNAVWLIVFVCTFLLNGAAVVYAEKGELLYSCENFENLDDWDNYTGKTTKFEEGAVVLRTSSAIVLKKELPPDILIEVKAKALLWKQQKTKGCGLRIILRVGKVVLERPRDFYDIQFHPTPDVPNWGGYRYILVWKRFAEKEEGDDWHALNKMILQKSWREGKAGEWYDVRVLIEGNTITVWLDGEEMLTVTDKENSFPTGRFGLTGWSWGNDAYFKDLKIWAVESEEE